MQETSLEPGAFALYVFARPAGSEAVPAAFDTAERLFDLATASYDAGRYREAAQIFVAASDALAGAAGAYTSTRDADRGIACRNATLAFLMAGSGDDARALARERSAKDPACAEAVYQTLGALARPPGATPGAPESTR